MPVIQSVRPWVITTCAAEFMDEPFIRFEQAVKEAYELGLLGKNIQGSGVDFDLHGSLGAGATSVVRRQPY